MDEIMERDNDQLSLIRDRIDDEIKWSNTMEVKPEYDSGDFYDKQMDKMFWGGITPEPAVKPDAVNPKHYKDIVPGYEYFDMMDYCLEGFSGAEAHALGNALKYLTRLGKKDEPLQEVRKAIWYLQRLEKYYEHGGYIEYRNRQRAGK